MELGGLWWTSVLNSALPPQRHRPDAQWEHQDPVIHREKEKKGKIYISLLPKSTTSIWDDSLSIQVFHRCRYIKLIVEIYSAAPEAAGRDFPFSPLFAQLLGFSFGFSSASVCRSPERICSCPDRTGLKEQLLWGLWLAQAEGREGYGGGASLRRQRPACRCSSLRRAVRSPGEVVPGSQDPGHGGLHRLLRGEVWIVTCACTQASWCRQQQS